MTEPHQPLSTALPIAQFDFEFNRCCKELVRSPSALSKNWLLAFESFGFANEQCLPCPNFLRFRLLRHRSRIPATETVGNLIPTSVGTIAIFGNRAMAGLRDTSTGKFESWSTHIDES